MKIGIIGAENSHAAAIAETINVRKAVDGFEVVAIWGETAEFAQKAAEKGQIPTIVEHESDMLGTIDALIVDHRHPKFHLDAARPYIEAGIPTFIDKPFCYRADKGRAFLELARKHGTPVTSFSVVQHQHSFEEFVTAMKAAGDLRALTSYGPCDLESCYGGIFFYGIHQVEYVLAAAGYDVESVLLTRNGDNATAQLFYPEGVIATLNLVKSGCPGFFAHALCADGEVNQRLVFDEQMYLAGIESFCEMFRTGEEPLSHGQILRRVQVLEALERSQSSGRKERVDA